MSTRRPTAPRGGQTGSPGRSAAERRGRASVRRHEAGPDRSRRPGPAARPRSPRAEAPAPPRGLSRRAAVLAVLLLGLAAVLAPYLRDYVEQRGERAALEADVAQAEEDVTRLQRELDRWDDPAYVAAQARERLTMVMPGETGYVVLDLPEQDRPDDAEDAAQAAPGGAWFGAVWESVRVAGAQPVAGAP